MSLLRAANHNQVFLYDDTLYAVYNVNFVAYTKLNSNDPWAVVIPDTCMNDELWSACKLWAAWRDGNPDCMPVYDFLTAMFNEND